MVLLPQIVTMIDGHEHSSDLISHEFLKKRVVYLEEVNTESAKSVITQLRFLSSKSDDDLYLVINSPGGSVSDGLAIYDFMKAIPCDVVTIGIGMAASMGAFLLSAGTKGKRYVSPNTEVMIHQPIGGVHGQAADISLVADHIQSVKAKLVEIMAENCGKKAKDITKDMDRDNWMSSDMAKKYGIVDHVGFPDNFCGGG